MNFLYESVPDYDTLKLEIYERHNSGYITESEKDQLMEAVLMKEINDSVMMEAAALDMAVMTKVLGIAAGAVAAAGAMVILVMKVISSLRVRDKIKASTELTAVNNDIKACNSKLKTLRAEIQDTINEYRREAYDAETRADFYGNRIARVTSTQYNYSTGSVDTVTNYSYNQQYDPHKADKERKKSAKYQALVQKYIAKRDELNQEITKLKHLKSRFLAVVRNNMEETEYQSIRDELDRLMGQLKI